MSKVLSVVEVLVGVQMALASSKKVLCRGAGSVTGQLLMWKVVRLVVRLVCR